MSERVQLSIPGPNSTTIDIETLEWETLAESLPEDLKAINHETCMASFEKLPDHTVLPLMDRNCFKQPWRRVYVVLDLNGRCVHVIGEDGAAVDEPEHGVHAGVQLLHGQENTFLDDFANKYYAPATEPEVEPIDSEEGGGEEGGGEDSDAARLRAALHIGARVAMCFGDPPTWYGGFVDEFVAAADSYICAFDDGDLRQLSFDLIQSSLASKIFRFPEEGELTGGLVNNLTGYPAAALVVRHREGRASEDWSVGVLVGLTKYTLGDDPMYVAFHVADDSFFGTTTPAVQRKTRSTQDENEKKQSIQAVKDKRGFHTFRRGDKVQFMEVEQHETCYAYVFAVTWTNPQKGGPSPKYLVLQEEASKSFFVGFYTQWQRVQSEGADADNDFEAQTLTAEEETQLIAEFESSNKLCHLSTAAKLHSAAQTISRNGPPYLAQSRKDAKKAAQKEHNKDLAKRLKQKLKGQGGETEGTAFGPNKRGKRNKRDPPPLPPAAAPTAAAPAAAPAAAAAALHLEQLQSNMRALQRELAVVKRAKVEAEAADNARTDSLENARTYSLEHHAPRGLQPSGPPQLPPGWLQTTDQTGTVYYYNTVLQRSQWDPPQPVPLPPPPRPLPPPAQRRSPRLSPTQNAHPSRWSEHDNGTACTNPRHIERLIAQHRAQLAHATTESLKIYHAGQIAYLESVAFS